ncbi:MAG: DUF1059 domain-containing protein [Anaerolineae bacterium]
MRRRETDAPGLRVECAACGMTITAGDKQELLEKLKRHSREQHGLELPELKAQEAIERGTT